MHAGYASDEVAVCYVGEGGEMGVMAASFGDLTAGANPAADALLFGFVGEAYTELVC